MSRAMAGMHDIDFLNKVLKTTTNSKILLTLDIMNMYPNIDNDLGQEAVVKTSKMYSKEHFQRFYSKRFEDSTGIQHIYFQQSNISTNQRMLQWDLR